MTTRNDFAADEWEGLVQLPRWIVAAASAVQRDLPYRTRHELEAGFIASAKVSDSGNAFVIEVAEETQRLFDRRSDVTVGEFSDRETAITAVLERAQVANQILKQK